MNRWGCLALIVLLGVLLSAILRQPVQREGLTCPALDSARGLVATTLGGPQGGPPLTPKEKQMGQLCELAQEYVSQATDNVRAIRAMSDAAKDHMKQTIGTASPKDLSAKTAALPKS